MPQYQPSYGTHVYTVEETLEAISAPPMGGVARHYQNVPPPREFLPSSMDNRKAMREQCRICTGNYCALVALK